MSGQAWLESRVVPMHADGDRPGVLIQLPDAYIVIRPEDARRAVALILDAADECDEARRTQ